MNKFSVGIVNISEANGSPLVQIKDLHFKRGRKEIFRGVNIDFPRGQITTILGPSGTGKTTLLPYSRAHRFAGKPSVPISVNAIACGRLAGRPRFVPC